MGVALALAGLSTAQTNPHFEVDIIFPRNETYTVSDSFPIAFALQNITAANSVGDFIINWGILALEDGYINRGRLTDSGALGEKGSLDKGNYTVLVTYTDVSEWIEYKKPGDVFVLRWNLSWPHRGDQCEGEPWWDGRSKVIGEIHFSIETDGEREWGKSKAVEPDVARAGECPVLASVVEIRPNAANSSCPEIVTGMEGTPCDVVVDNELAGSIESEVARLAAPAEMPDAYIPKGKDEDEEDAAGFLGPPMGTALAAACAVGYMALASWYI